MTGFARHHLRSVVTPGQTAASCPQQPQRHAAGPVPPREGRGHLGTTEPTRPTQTQPCAEEDNAARFCLVSAALPSSSYDTGEQERDAQSCRCAQALADLPRPPRTTTMQGTSGTQLQMGPSQISLLVKCFGNSDILGTQNV